MQRIECTGDDRNKGWCIFCGGPDETEDHVPSRVFLDAPHPDNPPVVSACRSCNGSFALDEEYMACAIECALAGSIDLAMKRPKIAGILEHSPSLRARLAAARYEIDGSTGFHVETDRIRRILTKLARGHVAYEQNEPQLEEPTFVAFHPFTSLDPQQRAQFFAVGASHERGQRSAPVRIQGWSEVGSRAMTREVLAFASAPHPDLVDGWVVVQPGNYRYRVTWGRESRVQLVIREYLVAEVAWDHFAETLVSVASS